MFAKYVFFTLGNLVPLTLQEKWKETKRETKATLPVNYASP